MKKLLSLLTILGLSTSSSAMVISCGNNASEEKDDTAAKRDLNDLQVKDLGDVNGSADLATKITIDDLINAINNKNEGWTLTKSDVVLVGDPTNNSAKLEASSSSKNYKGSVEVKFNFRLSFNVSILEDVINNTGLGAVARPNTYNVGYLMVPSYKSEDIMSSIKRFVVPLLDMAKMLGTTISYEQILDVANIVFLDSEDNVFENPNESNQVDHIKITAKNGKENNIAGIHIKGEAIIKIKTQKPVNEIVKVTELGDIEISNKNDDYMTKIAILNAFYNKNSIIDDNLKKQFEVTSYADTEATINTVINSDYASNDIKVKYTFKEEVNSYTKWDLSKMSKNDDSTFQPTIKITSENIDNTLYTEIFNSITDTKNQFKSYWEDEYLYDQEGNMSFIFDNQEKVETEYYILNKGKLSSKDFINKFDTIFDVIIDKTQKTIKVSVKSGQEKFDKDFAVYGEIIFKYTV
ncbi:hypothetical protein SCORR_v1c07880 [Spiroplasma corruscae]|uniref:Lipoprotein n=1 Tax=Spiroplasma corruscae TaxID=216934 RepID=A0A222EPV0_9MOLU|nr:hypothetical protein [Spiroplasma corruscae]ASP28560.1 hypothetical protein SCORR_v1c07880 [Spiroplasma corruscae]